MKVIIVGGVAGGASAATRLRRMSEKTEILMFEKGPHISFANCGLPYFIGNTIKDKNLLLLQTPTSFKNRFNVDVFVNHEVMAIDKAKKQVSVKNLLTNEEYLESYDKLLLSPGASPFIPSIENINNPLTFTLRNIPDMDKIISTIKTNNPQHITVIGGGFIGLEMLEAIHHLNIKATLLERSPQIMAPVDIEMANKLHIHLKEKNVDLRLGQSMDKVSYNNNALEITTNLNEKISTDMLILAVGVKPDVKLAVDAGLKIGSFGGIVVNNKMETSEKDIYAVGDAVETLNFTTEKPSIVPLAGPANRQGRLVADVMLGLDAKYKNTQGTAICKVFDLTIASTGLNEKQLTFEGIDYEKIYINAGHHAGYYPGAEPILFKLLFCKTTGKIFGGQAVGKLGVDKRIDVLSVAQRAGLTVFDLQDLELTYAPPYNSAKDIINQAGFVASNILKGDMKVCQYTDVNTHGTNQIILDIRTQKERDNLGFIPNSIHIPVDELRQRLVELPKDKEILVYCQTGMRGTVGYRILVNNGFIAKNLTGGYNLWKIANSN